jgi:hypothetical protein
MDLMARCAEVRAKASVDRIVRRVSVLTGIPVSEIMARTRKSDPATEARRIAMYECHREGMTFAQIGRAFGRDHSTVIWACEREKLARAGYPDCMPGGGWGKKGRGAGCSQHADASDHSDAERERRHHG